MYDMTESHLRSANLQDSGDCVKRLLCELNADGGGGGGGGAAMDWDEELIMRAVSTRCSVFVLY